VKIIPKKPFTWLLIAVAVYAYVTYPKDNYVKTADILPKNSGQISVTPDKKEPGITDKPVNSLVQTLSKTDTGKAFVRALAEDAYKKKYGDKDVSTVTAQETNKLITLDSFKGDGAAVVCGSTVEVNYESFNENNLILDSTAGKKPLTFKVGSKQVIKGLENGVVGMKKGGKRRIAIPSRLAYDDPEFKSDIAKNSPVMFEVELLGVKDGFESADTLAIENVTSGDGVVEALCGNDVSLTYKVLENDKEIASGPMSFRVGNGNVPVGLEKGVMEMKIGAIRKLFIPQSLQKIKSESILPENIKLPESGNLTLEIVLVGVN
jgi:FKBP-type peptidyl-prolyl cis-trans isomerase